MFSSSFATTVSTVAIVTISIFFFITSTAAHTSQLSYRTNFVHSSPHSSWLPQAHRHRAIRSVNWEWSIDALKCTLKIMSLQVSRYHNNKIMCCGLWKLKTMLKESALAVCDKANNSIAAFDEMITEEVIYSQFSRSLLGDETLDCAAYPEGSPSCDRFFSLLLVSAILIGLLLIAVIIGFFIAVYCTLTWRRKYLLVCAQGKYQDTTYHKANSMSDLSEDSNTNNNNNNNDKLAGDRVRKSVAGRLMSAITGPVQTKHRPLGEKPYLHPRSSVGMKPKSIIDGENPINGELPLATAVSGCDSNGGQITPSDGRCSTASTSSSTVPSLHKDDQV